MTVQTNIYTLGVGAIIAIAIVAAASVWADSIPTVSTLCGYMAVLAAAAAAWRLNRWRSAASAWVLLALWTLLAVIGIADLQCYSSHPGASICHPWLANPDSRTIYSTAATAASERFAEGVYNPRSIFFGLIYMAFGPSPAAMIMACAAAVVVAVACAGVIAGATADATDADRRRLSALAMGLTAAVCHLTAMGTVILKDSFVIAGVALLGVALLRFIPQRDCIATCSSLACGAAGILLIATLRIEYLVYVPAGVAFMLPWVLRRKAPAAALLLFAVGAAGLYIAYRHSFICSQSAIYIFDTVSPTRQSYNSVAAWILSAPWWMRLLCLPMTAAVQYLIPLPWTAADDAAFGPGFVFAHFSLPWYAVGGLILTALLLWRRIPGAMLRIALLGAVVWLVPAYAAAGMVNRYTLAAIPLMAPAGAYAWLRLRSMRRVKLFLAIYAALIVAALGVVYMFIQSSLS